MKRIIFLFAFTLLIVSCEKAKIEPNHEIPNWLKDRINHDEEIIKFNPQSGLDIAAWVRYNYNGNYYFEYINLLSSLGPRTYKYDGSEYIYTQKNFFDYQSKKCCRYYVWKGPSYIDILD